MGSASKKPARAKLFKNGRSQAVRLPREFRFKGKEVNIRREGDAIILEPITRRTWPPGYWERLREARFDFEVEPLRPKLEEIGADER
ncbi:MAG: antitoxin [Candidatus Binatia bacterium]